MEIWFYKRNILTRVGRNCTAVGLLRVTAQQLCQQQLHDVEFDAYSDSFIDGLNEARGHLDRGCNRC